MKRYVIERDLPGFGGLSTEECKGAAEKSNEALATLGGQVQWLESFGTQDKTFCIYLAENEDAIRKHAVLSGFPASRITEVVRMLDPTTAG